MRWIIFLVGILAMAAVDVWAGFDPHNVRPIAELDLMDEHDLANEAAPACFFHVHGDAIAMRYFNTIGLLVKKRTAGKTPTWYQEMELAIIGHNADGCYDAASRYHQAEHEKTMEKIRNWKPSAGTKQ